MNKKYLTKDINNIVNKHSTLPVTKKLVQFNQHLYVYMLEYSLMMIIYIHL